MPNREKALLVDSLRGKYSLKELLAAVSMAKSSYECASSALNRPETDGRKALREAVVKAFGDSGGTYGYRRLLPEVNSMDGIVRSMSRKGHSPDNSRMEGFFGRLTIEFFYGRDRRGATMDELMGMLDGYMIRYRGRRRKSDPGYVSPMQYRKNLGLAA